MAGAPRLRGKCFVPPSLRGWGSKQNPKHQNNPPPQNLKQILSESVSGLSPSLVFGCKPKRLDSPCPGCSPVSLPPVPDTCWHKQQHAPGHTVLMAQCHAADDATAALASGPVASSHLASALPVGLPASAAGPGCPTCRYLPMGCAYRRAFLADFWLRGDLSRADKLPGLSVTMEGLLPV